MAKRVSVINFKGGVGKTTLAFHLATGLARFHDARVLLIDMDHQSSLSIICLGTDGWQTVADARQTTSMIFEGFTSGDLPGDEVIRQAALHPAYEGVDIVPASLDLDDIEIKLTAASLGDAVESEWKKRTLMCRWLDETGVDREYDYILFDCAPATKIISQNAIASSHGYICPVVPESVMERGAPHLRSLISTGIDAKLQNYRTLMSPQASYVPDTGLVGLVVTRMQVAGNARSGYTNDHTQHLESLKRDWGDALVMPHINHGTGLSSALTERLPVYERADDQNSNTREVARQYKELTAELQRRMDDL